MLDPRITLLVWYTKLAGRAYRPGMTVEQARAIYADLNRRWGFAPETDVVTRRIAIPARDGAELSGLLHEPAQRRSPGMLLYFHGGGFCVGSADDYAHLTQRLAHDGGMPVLSVDYRLGPEWKFPTAIEDGFDAFAWLQAHARDFACDPGYIAVGGDSSGGAIAAAISAFAHERSLAAPAYQLLIYPPLDATERFPSRSSFAHGVPFTAVKRRWWAQNFQRSPADRAHPYLTQIEAPHPERLPPTYFLAAGYDALLDEGRAYAARLREAGVPVVYDLRPTLAHGFVSFPRILPEARRALRDAMHATANALRE